MVKTSFVNNYNTFWPVTAVRVEHSDLRTQRPLASPGWAGREKMNHLPVLVLSLSYSFILITSGNLACAVLEGLVQLWLCTLPGCSSFILSKVLLLDSLLTPRIPCQGLLLSPGCPASGLPTSRPLYTAGRGNNGADHSINFFVLPSFHFFYLKITLIGPAIWL